MTAVRPPPWQPGRVTRPGTSPSRRSALVLGGLLSVGAAAVLGGDVGPSSGRSLRFPSGRVGVAGPYSEPQLEALHRRGVRRLLLEASWAGAQPAAGVWDEAYLDRLATTATAWRTAGFSVALNTGTMDGPGWVLDLPGSRWVDQDGIVYGDHPVPNAVFSSRVRELCEDYLSGLFRRLGDDFDLVRAGGSVWGEIAYPGQRTASGRWRNAYWCFDPEARRRCPVPDLTPGTPDAAARTEDAAEFLDWYLDELVGFQTWQLAALRRAGVRGRIAMLYPSFGMRPGDADAAAATGLAGTTSPEVNGEVQRGLDFARLVGGLSDPDTAVYGTWGENVPVLEHLSDLARRSRRGVMAENAGGASEREVRAALSAAGRLGLEAFYLVRAADLFERGNGRWPGVLDVIAR